MSYILGLDLDGVTFDYTDMLREHMIATTGRPAADFPNPEHWSLCDSGWFTDLDQYKECHNTGVTAGMFATAKVLPGAREGLQKLRDNGVQIRVTTNRLIGDHNHAAAIGSTVTALAVNNIPYDELCVIRDKTDVYADLNIDDSPEVIRGLRQVGRKVLIFDQPYNRHLEGDRVRSWDEAVEYVLAEKVLWSGLRRA